MNNNIRLDDINIAIDHLQVDMVGALDTMSNLRDDLNYISSHADGNTAAVKARLLDLETEIYILKETPNKHQELYDDIQYMNGRDKELSCILHEYDGRLADLKKHNEGLQEAIATAVKNANAEQVAMADVIARGAKYEALYNQVLDAVGFSSEAIVNKVITHEELLDLLKDSMDF